MVGRGCDGEQVDADEGLGVRFGEPRGGAGAQVAAVGRVAGKPRWSCISRCQRSWVCSVPSRVGRWGRRRSLAVRGR